MCWTGLFSAHWESSDRPTQFAAGPDRVSVNEAIAWGRSKADVVMVRLGECEELGAEG
jgi:hypothetical protein